MWSLTSIDLKLGKMNSTMASLWDAMHWSNDCPKRRGWVSFMKILSEERLCKKPEAISQAYKQKS